MIQSLLIANRGEIACRIIRTARRLGIRTVAVYSDADADALHVRSADAAVPIGPAPARESYLRGEAIIAAAKASGAQAIHPGYGFLSENAAFAQSVIDAGLIWVGPDPASITAMGLKDAAKHLMAGAGVPVTPGYLGEDQSEARLHAEADGIGYPVLIKAVAGGGGKGMRRVDASADFADALASCRREAAASFGDDRVLIEKYILSPRHIEVQIFGDRHGGIVHLFERDCSLQRRHQKVIEEAPAPGMDAATREAICAAAVRAARAVDYVGAGTIEFIADGSAALSADRIWFMEMNTRLQVEHPVTEAITGVDLVEWQLRVAAGEPLPLRQEELAIHGHAVEARLYAEDPAKGFLPSIGRLEVCRFPTAGARIETGVDEGDAVSPYYDPMIAKIVAHGEDRAGAIALLQGEIGALAIWPVRTNAGFLWRALGHRVFRAGAMTTGFIEDHQQDLIPPAEPEASLLAQAARLLIERQGEGRMPHFPGFRLNAAPVRAVRLEIDHQVHEAMAAREPLDGVHVLPLGEGGVLLTHAGRSFGVAPARAQARGGGAVSDGMILSPMPGSIVAVEVAQGDRVVRGQKLVTLEAMKMEHALTAPFDGQIMEMNAVKGGQVAEGALLVRVEPDQD